MANFIEEDRVLEEISEESVAEDIVAGSHRAPLNRLTDSQFELLLWSIFRERNPQPEYYDRVTLMISGADRGRDVWLTKNKSAAGLVQCKRVNSAFSAPAALREIIKFILFAELDPSLRNGRINFKYTLAVSSDPALTTVELFTSPKKWLKANDTKINAYVQEVIGKYKSFEGLKAANVSENVKTRLEQFEYELLRPAEIDDLLHDLPRVRQRFFKANSIIDGELFSELFDDKVREHSLGRSLSGKALELLDEAILSEVDTLRRSRFFAGIEIKKSALALIKKLVQGEYGQASNQIRADALASCARWLSRLGEIYSARDALAEAAQLAASEDAEIAKAFLRDKTDWAGALEDLSPLENPGRRTAALQAIMHGCNAERALQWFEDAGYQASDLDSDGKAIHLICLLEDERWADFERNAGMLQQGDYANTPILSFLTAMAELLSVVPDDLKGSISDHLPLAPEQFPLADDPASIERRRLASQFFRQAEIYAEEFGSIACHAYGSFALWLELRDPAGRSEAEVLLADALSDNAAAIHYIPLGIAFDLNVDMSKIEEVLSREEARFPKGKPEISIARFIVAIAKKDAKDALDYFERHKTSIQRYVAAESTLEFEVQTKTHVGNLTAAREVLDRNAGKINSTLQAKLEKIVRLGDAGVGVANLEEAYREDASTSNLTKLVEALARQGFSERYSDLARKLVSKTKSTYDAECVVQFMMANGRYDEAQAVLTDVSSLLQFSPNLRGALAWLDFRNGAFDSALQSVLELRKIRSEKSDRSLHQKVLVASGRWEELAAYVENEWTYRDERSPVELLALSQLSAAVDSPRLKGFLLAAAHSGEDDPNVLLGCYSIATETGLEESADAIVWFEKAAALSGDDGPIQRKSLSELVKEQPAWNEHVESVWERYRKAEMPFSLVASQLRRSSLEMQVSAIVTNTDQIDPRKRAVVSAFSGVRMLAKEIPRKIGLESTALITLATLELLETVVDYFDEVHIPHSTLGWLFIERQKLSFHQPSRTKAANELLTAFASGKVSEFRSAMSPDAELSTKVDLELARMLTSASADDGKEHTIVVRGAPVHKVGSLMDEDVDLSEFKDNLCSCQALVDKLVDLAVLVEQDERAARIFLERTEQRWLEEQKIEDGARLLLDDLSVSYLQTSNLLRLLSDAGFDVFVPKSSLSEARTLVELDARSEDYNKIIEGVRVPLSRGIVAGKVKVDRVFSDDELKEHPNVAALQLAERVDAVVSDDRCFNQFQRIDGGDSPTQVLTSLDILDALRLGEAISDAKLMQCRTYLRKAGYVLFPTASVEIIEMLSRASVRDGRVFETADLKAFRENLLFAQMRGWLVLSKENVWFEQVRSETINALTAQWRPSVSDEASRAFSRWLLGLLDIRNWAGSITENDGSGLARFGWAIVCHSLALRHSDISDSDAADRFGKWLEEEVYEVLRREDPVIYEWLKSNLKEMLTSHFEQGEI